MTVRKYGKYWWSDFMYNGKRYRQSTKTANKFLAQQIETKIRDEIISGRWFHKEPFASKNFRDLVNEFWNGRYVSPCSFGAYQSVVKSLEVFFGNTPLSSFNIKLVEDFRNHLIQSGKKPNTIIHQIKILKRLFNIATTNWEWFSTNPIHGFKIGTSTSRERRLSEQEEEMLLSASPLWLREYILFLLNCGLRRSEALRLTWKDVDFSNKIIFIGNTKNKTPLSIPMNDWMYGFLREKSKVRKLQDGRIFLFKDYTLEVEFRKVCDSIGLTDLRIHDLRHTVASRLISKGENVTVVQRLLNHKTLAQTGRYIHNSVEDLRSAVSKLSSK